MNVKNSSLNQWFKRASLSQLNLAKSSRFIALVFGAGLLSACSTTPETIDFDQQSSSFNRVAQQPESYVGNQVRWGGIIARVENLEYDTLIEIVSLPLDSRARPIANQQTGGRYIARVQGFVEPLIYKQGKEITVVGVLSNPMPGHIGEHRVNFPVVDTSGHHLWEQRQSYQRVNVFSTWDPFFFGASSYRWHFPYHNRYSRFGHYPRFYGGNPYCPVHRSYHRHAGNDHVDHRALQAAPSPTHVDRVRTDTRVDVNNVQRHTLRDGVVRPVVRPTVRPVQVKPQRIREADIPKTPRRIHPKIKQVKIPKPTPPIRMPKKRIER